MNEKQENSFSNLDKKKLRSLLEDYKDNYTATQIMKALIDSNIDIEEPNKSFISPYGDITFKKNLLAYIFGSFESLKIDDKRRAYPKTNFYFQTLEYQN